MNKKFSWEPIDDFSDIYSLQYFVPNFRSRSMAFLSKNNKLILISPPKDGIDHLPDQLNFEGSPDMILIPNSFHHFGVKNWVEKYPKINLFSSEQAKIRLNKLGIQSIKSLKELKKELPEHITLLEPKGNRSGEVWLKVEENQKIMWIVCDAFFNYKYFSKKPIARLMQIIMKAAPGLKMSNIVKYVLTKDRKAYKKWILEQVEKDKPTILVPAHGEILRSKKLSEMIKKLIEKRL